MHILCNIAAVIGSVTIALLLGAGAWVWGIVFRNAVHAARHSRTFDVAQTRPAGTVLAGIQAAAANGTLSAYVENAKNLEVN